MPDILAVDVDQASALQLSVTGASPHVFAYRFWYQEPGATTWTKCGEGHTADETPDSFSVGPLPAGSTVAWWIAVTGHANTPYRVLVSFAQGGATLAGGVVTHEGTTSASGGAVVQHRVALA